MLASHDLAQEGSPLCVLHRRSSSEVPAAERFEFCREMAIGSHIEPPAGTTEDFRGDFAYAVTRGGIGYVQTAIDPCVSHFGAGNYDSVVDIAVLSAGTMHIQRDRDQRQILSAGDMPVLFDPAQPLTIRSSRTKFAALRLPRTAVDAALGHGAREGSRAIQALPSTTLGSELATCFKQLERASSQPALPEAVLSTAGALALVLLAHRRGPGHRWPGILHPALYLAARHQLALGVANPALTVDTIAATLGCSRAQLYRLFAEHGQGIAGELNRLRMQQAGNLLRSHAAVGVGVIATRCGYAEPAAFDKAFRRHYGMTPRDWRALGRRP